MHGASCLPCFFSRCVVRSTVARLRRLLRLRLPRLTVARLTVARLTAALVVAVVLACLVAPRAVEGAEGKPPARVLLLGQKRDHPPGTHEYVPGLRVVEKCLRRVGGLEVTVLDVTGPWPDGPERLAQADGIVLYLGEGGKWMQEDPQRWKAVQALAARGGAIVGLHWGIGAKEDRYVPGHLAMMGGMHGGSDRKYVFTETTVTLVAPDHPIARGVEPREFRLNDEFYYRLKFAAEGKVTPILQAAIDGRAETCCWAFERPDGGRSFGFGCLHNHDDWRLPQCRRLVCQGILWAMKLPVPDGGLDVAIADEDLKLE